MNEQRNPKHDAMREAYEAGKPRGKLWEMHFGEEACYRAGFLAALRYACASCPVKVNSVLS